MAEFSKAILASGLNQFFEHSNFVPGYQPISKEKIANERFVKLLDYHTGLLFRNSRLKISTIAARMAVCERQLCRKTKKILGLTPGQYLKKFRLNQASRLLTEGKSITRVSMEVGFSSYHYFAKCFKDEFGCTASDYVERQLLLNKWQAEPV